jgi:hypothetical protein
MNRTIKRAFCKEYNNGYDSARELTLELLDRYHYHACESQQLAIDGVQQTLDAIDMACWRDDTSPDQILKMIREIEMMIAIINTSNPSFLILTDKVNAALKRCIDVLVVA